MSTGTRVYNGYIHAPWFARRDLIIVALNHGMNIVLNEGESRFHRTVYPFVRTSGTWFVRVVFTSMAERNDFNSVLVNYIERVSDPEQPMLPPMTLSVPSEQFTKVGFPVSAIEYDDEVPRVIWGSTVAFKSASNPELQESGASRYRPPLSDAAARKFYPTAYPAVGNARQQPPDSTAPNVPPGGAGSGWIRVL